MTDFADGNLLAVFDSTVDGRLQSCNDAFAHVLGFENAAAAADADLNALYVDASQRERFVEEIRAEGHVRNASGRLRRLDGQPVHVMMTGIGDRDAAGTLTGIHGFLVDVTDVAERATQSEKLETVGRLAGGIAHDFNNLLTAVLGYAELLMANERLGDVERRDVAEIQRAGQRAASLTQQLLAFSRKQVLLPKDIDLNTTVAHLRGMLVRLIREDIALTCEVAARPALVRIDPAQIEQVLLHLVLNARDALPGGGFIRLELSHVERADIRLPRDVIASSANDFVRLRVIDNGVGIAPEALPHLFEPFFTTKDVGKGTGLGLASVYGIVKQSNGFIVVESAPGSGSCFSLYFPAVVVADDAAAREGNYGTILLVEDEDSVRTTISAVLQRSGYRVLEAGTASTACELFAREADHIDLLVSDVVMPDMNGPALAQRLIGVRSDLRILFISGYADAAGALSAISPNVSFLNKPFYGSVLVEHVREMIA